MVGRREETFEIFISGAANRIKRVTLNFSSQWLLSMYSILSREILPSHFLYYTMSKKQSHQELDVVIIGSGTLHLLLR